MSALRLATQDGAPVPTGADLHDHFHAPAGESKEDRERRLARDRKRAQRAREAQAKLKAEAVKVPLELYQGTVKALQAVIAAGGFEGPQAAEEAITLLLHGAAALAARDSHAFAQLIAPPSHQVAADADA
ncbi:hypothetical protein VVF04_30215 [Pseudomonas aeruginosa]|jgi:autotransporter adhesin|uniref:hypothetical protein n=1 Tax=Pseudomonas aeruginosa TaxID=287 RepID=UPI000AB3C632|nr:hypothetical protein [Pseudomonas aeruginosa]EKV4056028.1 hypothetical protein [Pseudomonas aeruginosa]ELM1746565.1 hypothetical protein [Pseudomonas aeruginosa]EMF0828754.1 hypothetical protein [Pseudomonas aeruginosa]MBA5020943.1 hypothetical protein [Pseudomonas aeruginosa]MBG5323032.1 hypothetical protein [Pseudomonas aeruginosa]